MLHEIIKVFWKLNTYIWKKTTNYDYYRVTCTDNRGVNTVFPNDGDLIVLVEQQHVLLLRQMIHWKLM